MSKNLIRGLILSLAFIFSIGILFSFINQAKSETTASQQYTITVPEPTARDAGGKLYYDIKDYGVNAVLGLPILPHKKLFFEVPSKAKNINASLVSTTSRSLGVVNNLGVFQGFAPSDTINPVVPDLAAARSKYTLATFPAENFKDLGGRSLKSHRLICVAINPLVQNLATNEVTFYDSFTIKIEYSIDDTLPVGRVSANTSPVFEQTARKLIYNYQEAQPLKTLNALTEFPVVSLQPINNVPIKYAIITLPENASAMQPMADWKTKKGIPAKIYTTDWIDANYTGADIQEKIRKFLTENSPNPPYNPFYSAKFDWLLIAGEQGAGMPDTMAPAEGVKLPAKYVGPVTWWTDGVNPDNDLVPADYYYADCADSAAADSEIYNWDTNNNGISGELSDDIRWVPDTYVGRIPTNKATELTAVVNKLIAYEKTPAAGTWTKEVVLAGAKADDYTDGATVMQFIKNDFLDPTGLANYRLYYLNNYPKEADLSEANFISFVSQGRTLVEWASHGSNMRALLYQTGPYFLKGDVSTISNGDKRSVVYAEACDNGRFDYYYYTPSQNLNYSIGDSILIGYNKPDWGIGFIGSSRTSYYWIGWNSPTQSGDDGDNYRFNREVFQNGKYHLGQALYDTKLQIFNDFSGNPTFDPNTDLAMRKNLFVVNLLGDPELELWTDTPKTFSVDYNPSMYRSNGVYNFGYMITARDSNSLPVADATITLYKTGDAFGTGQTDANGQVYFGINTASAGQIAITVTKHNFIPFEGTATVSNYVAPYQPPRKWSCPYIYNWNGTEFVKDNDILPAGNPMYYHDYYKLMKPLVAKDGKYMINIVDSEDETSWIDMVKLIQVDHPKDVKIAPTPDGNILTYKIPVPALSAVDRHKKDQLAKVAYVESTEEASYYGEKGDKLELNFGKPKDISNGARLIMRTDLKCPYSMNDTPLAVKADVSAQSLHVFVLVNNKSWVKVGVVHPHQGWDEWAVAIPDKVLKQVKGDVKVKIEWTKPHRLDYVGLDTSKQEAVVVAELPLLKAEHSKAGDVLKAISQADNKPAVTVLDQQINLEFSSLSTPDQARSFIFESAGKYKANRR